MKYYKILKKSQLIEHDIIELLQGEYKEIHWNDSSIFFMEDDFLFFEFFIEKIIHDYKNGGHFGVTKINKEQWLKILNLINIFLKNLANMKSINDLKEFEDNFNLNKLITLLKSNFNYKNTFIEFAKEVTKWISNTMDKYNCITLLGV